MIFLFNGRNLPWYERFLCHIKTYCIYWLSNCVNNIFLITLLSFILFDKLLYFRQIIKSELWSFHFNLSEHTNHFLVFSFINITYLINIAYIKRFICIIGQVWLHIRLVLNIIESILDWLWLKYGIGSFSNKFVIKSENLVERVVQTEIKIGGSSGLIFLW